MRKTMVRRLTLLLFVQTAVLGAGNYHLDVIVRTGDRTAGGNTISSLGWGSSINDTGRVAYIATVQDGRQGVFVSGESAARSNAIESFAVGSVTVGGLSRNFYFDDVLEINNQNRVAWRVWSRDGLFSFIFRLGSSADDFKIVANTRYERIDPPPLDMPSPFSGLFPFPTKGLYPWVTLNNSGRTVFSGVLWPEGVDTVLAIPRNPEMSRLTSSSDYFLSDPVSGYPNLFPAVTDDDYTLVRMGGDGSAPLILFDGPRLKTGWWIAGSPDFTWIGDRSGISDDSVLVAFSGIRSSEGIGIYGEAGAGVFKIAGISGDGHCDPGETWADTNNNGRVDPGEDDGPFSAFYPEPRVAVNRTGCGSPTFYKVVFLASRADSSATGPGPLGLYTVNADASDPGTPLFSEPELVLETGQFIEGLPGAVNSIALYDPINSHGQLSFWAQCPGSQAIIRATPDSDGDGLLDPWESEGGGIDIDDDGVPDYDLYSLGARPCHKDIFVEVDLMDTVAFPEDCRSRLEEAFANAPVDNPDSTNGINLHVVVDDTSLPHVEQWPIIRDWPAQFDPYKELYFGTETERDARNPKIIEAKKWAFHYCIVCDKLDVDGKGEVGGNDFVLAGGNSVFNSGYRDSECLAGCFMHELGHNLGLEHGGQDNIEAKPNYISVMNPILAHPIEAWSDEFWRLDYSRGGLNDLNEVSLDEDIGILDAEGLYPNFKMPYGIYETDAKGQTKRALRYATLGNGICVDWNGDDECGGISQQDLNYFPPGLGDLSRPSEGDFMRCYNDWSSLEYKIRTQGD